MNAVSPSAGLAQAQFQISNPDFEPLSDKELLLKEKFQDLVAGTFYKQMFKALRKGQQKPAYMHGGTAEEMFQSQMDQQVAENLARSQGDSFAGPLFTTFARQLQNQLSTGG